jgi:phosphate transport system protein
MNGPHIFKGFDQALQSLRGEVLTMASLTRQNLQRAVDGLLQRDVELCRRVIADDSEIDEFESAVDRTGMDLMLRFHPVAADLRMVISSMKIATNLERISDHAVNIAKRAKKILKRSELAEATMIEPLYHLADALLLDAVTAYVDGDKELDRMHKALTATLSQRLDGGGAGGRSEDILHLIFMVRSLERVGDLSVNIGEDAVFMESARDIRHGGRDPEAS